MGDCTLWIKWLFFDRIQVGNYPDKDRLGLQEPKSWQSARTDAKCCTWDRQTLWLLTQPEEQLCRQGPGKVWLSPSQSTALEHGELRDGPTGAQTADPGVQFHSPQRLQAEDSTQGGICQYKTDIRKLQWGHWKATKTFTGWNTCPMRTEDAGFLQPAEETGLG